MRLLMLGTGPFAVPTFSSLLDSPHEVLLLVTRPTRAAQARDKHALNPMRDAAEARGVKVLAPESVNAPETVAELAALRPDLLVVCDYGQILQPAALGVARLGGINLHGSLLPTYRGAAPVAWAVYHGETETGVSVIHMTAGLDAGPILSLARTAIGASETTAELEPRLAQLGVSPVHEALALLEKWDGRSPLGAPQDRALATKAPRLKKTDGAIDFRRTAEEIRNQVRAFQPWPGSYTFWHRQHSAPLRISIDRVSVIEPAPSASNSTAPGTVHSADGKQLLLATGRGVLSVDQLQPAGKRSLPIAEFLRGHAVAVGEKFGPEEAATNVSGSAP